MTVDQLKACCTAINLAIETEDGVEAEAAAAANDGVVADVFMIEGGIGPLPASASPDFAAVAGLRAHKGIPASPAVGAAKTAVPSSKKSQFGQKETVRWEDISDKMKTLVEGSLGVADANRVFFDTQVAPQLLPDDLSTFTSSETVRKFKMTGMVAVKSQFDSEIKYQGDVPGSKFAVHATISDCGEAYNGKLRRCEPIRIGAAYRTDVGIVYL